MLAIEIPACQWQCAERKLQEGQGHKKRKYVRQFTYDLHLGDFCGCSALEATNLFFECASFLGEDICEKYLVLELRDGAADGDRFKSLQYQTDTLREGILRSGLRQNPDGIRYNLVGCSSSQA